MLEQDYLGRSLRITAAAMMVVAPVAAAEQPPSSAHAFEYHHADILGTVMDLTVVAASQAEADAADKTVLAEIQRLAGILSGYNADSELARLNASPVNGPGLAASPELIDVLRQYDRWFARSEGAYNGHAGDLIALWTSAEKSTQLPSNADLLSAARRCRAPAWEINMAAKTVRRISDQQINVDSLGKGYIIDKAVAAATRPPTKLKGLLLNIGGDLRAWGNPAGPAGTLWAVGVQDPAHPELNAKPLTTIYIAGNRSVSSSGAYQRFYTIDGKQYSHILDARTGQSGRNPAATVVAPDTATANALATIACSMKFTEASALVRSVPNAESMIILADGTQVRSDGFKALEDTALAGGKGAPGSAVQFPSGYKLSISLETTPTQRRPYVFAWITDSAGRHVKTLAAYGNNAKWLREMREWWKLASNDRKLQSVTHATQRAGKYPLVWDGTNQQGAGVPLGKYTVWVEVGSEHGPYAARFASIDLGKGPATAVIGRSSAFSDVALTYGPGAN
jgi:thiamine biosynthesis lipoprotein